MWINEDDAALSKTIRWRTKMHRDESAADEDNVKEDRSSSVSDPTVTDDNDVSNGNDTSLADSSHDLGFEIHDRSLVISGGSYNSAQKFSMPCDHEFEDEKGEFLFFDNRYKSGSPVSVFEITHGLVVFPMKKYKHCSFWS